ncbi:DUF1799 domain-containing protein [Thauera humireducens]|uniref:DUF1799 domain-containing protein n=1 Tax=Thauera humireducens TaxID=1134435 RepID=UPI00312016E6
MAANGLTRADFETEEVEVFPCCWESVMFFRSLPRGAWDHGMNGPSRLDYRVINDVLFDHFGVKKKRRKQILADLFLMEGPALKEIHSK